MGERNILLDFLKGFTIILVVLGHSIQFSQNNFDANPIFRIIYSFHMPMFMFISGFVSFKTFDGSYNKLVKRFKSLMIPFWAWFVFGFVFSYLKFYMKCGEFPNFIYSLTSVIKRPDYGLWFLWVLFLNYILLFLSLKINSVREEIILLLFFIGINIFKNLTGFNYLGIDLLCWHMQFYIVGYATNKYILKLKSVLNISGLFSIIIFPILVSFWTRSNHPVFYDYLPFNHGIKAIISFLYRVLVPISGILAIYVFFEWLIQKEFILKSGFLRLGKLSLEIYSTHFYFFCLVILLPNIPAAIKIIIVFLVALFGSLLVQFLIKKSKYLSMAFYGK